MADNPKAAWPKTPDGTTDWEQVFEDPSAGLIPLISQAKSATALKVSAGLILQKLFSRKNDVDERKLLTARLESIVSADGSVDGMLREVTVLLREVKVERIEKARVYVERKQASAAIDRRAGLFWKIDKLLAPSVLIPVGLVFVFALSGLVYLMLQSTLGPTSKVDAAAAAATAVEQANREKIEAEEKAAREAAESEPIPVMFKSVRWPLATQFTTERPQYYSVIIYVANWDQKIEVCRRISKVMDRFYVSFSDVMPPNRPARDEEMKALERKVVSEINAILPDSYVSDAKVARYGTKGFRLALRPPYCWSPTN